MPNLNDVTGFGSIVAYNNTEPPASAVIIGLNDRTRFVLDNVLVNVTTSIAVPDPARSLVLRLETIAGVFFSMEMGLLSPQAVYSFKLAKGVLAMELVDTVGGVIKRELPLPVDWWADSTVGASLGAAIVNADVADLITAFSFSGREWLL